MSQRLSRLTVIGITTLSALKRGPGCSEPSAISRYMPMSPSSAFETYTKVTAMARALRSAPARAATSAAARHRFIPILVSPRRHRRAQRYLVGDDVASVGQKNPIAGPEFRLVDVAHLAAAVGHAHGHAIHGLGARRGGARPAGGGRTFASLMR